MNFMSISCLLFCFYIFPQAARRYYSYIVIMWCGDGSIPKIINKVPCRVMGGGEKTGRWQLWSWWYDNKVLNGGNGWGHRSEEQHKQDSRMTSDGFGEVRRESVVFDGLWFPCQEKQTVLRQK